jgi:hypothetical protein
VDFAKWRDCLDKKAQPEHRVNNEGGLDSLGRQKGEVDNDGDGSIPLNALVDESGDGWKDSWWRQELNRVSE